MVKYKIQCFAFIRLEDGRASCDALKKIQCENCNFYKTTKKSIKQVPLKKIGYLY